MIVRLVGKLIERKDGSLILDVGGIFYEIYVPASAMQRLDQNIDAQGNLHLMIYHYLQIGPSSGNPVLVGFLSDLEKDFFLQFITVSGIGPRAAVKALSKPICEITAAIEKGDMAFLKTLPGIGMQKAKDIVAKLQGKVGRYGLIQDKVPTATVPKFTAPDWQEEALNVLLQLQYKKPEAVEMIQKALKRSTDIQSTEELLNEIYKQKVSV